jgi:4-amino-4-deoxy-L-arabinose transferase-like glycosyltransferase
LSATDRGPERGRGIALVVVALTLAAAALRFWGLRFGLPPTTLARPDEEAIAATAAQIVLHGPDPKFFDYPTLFMYAVALVERVWPGGPPVFHETQPTMIARALAALLGTLSVPLLFVAARALFRVPTAIISSALLAVAFLHVRDSHFGVTDVPMTFMVLAAFTAIATLRLDSEHWWNIVLAALLCGLATSTKYNALVITAPLVAAMVLNRNPAWTYGAALASVVAGFLIGTPYAAITPGRFWAGLAGLQSHLASGHGADEGLGWVHHFTFSLRYGVGPAFLAAAVGGCVWLLAFDRRRAVLVLSFPLLYYAGMGSGRTVFMRHMTPMIPFVAMLAGVAIERAGGWVAARIAALELWRSPSGLRSVAITALTALAGYDSAARAMALDRLLVRRDSRAIAADFIKDRYFPRGASIYQNGAVYGRVKPWPEGLYPETPLAQAPDLAIVHGSWLVAYNDRPDEMIAAIARHYRLIDRIDVENRGSDTIPIFDQQDAFFVPVSGFDRFVRPGPAIEIYERVH